MKSCGVNRRFQANLEDIVPATSLLPSALFIMPAPERHGSEGPPDEPSMAPRTPSRSGSSFLET